MQLDRELFDARAIDPADADFNAGIEARAGELPAVHQRAPATSRRMREEGVWGPIVRLEQATERTVPGLSGRSVPVRILEPPTVQGVYLFVHGGGWVLGAADQQDQALWQLATNCNLAIVSVDYRLAPEDPYPAGPDDCEAAALWLAQHAQQQFGTDRLAIGGRSAGAHLAVVALLRLRDRHDVTPFRCAELQFGAYDLRMTPSARNWGERPLVLSTPAIEWHIRQFLGDHDPADPDASPLLADLQSLPPALFTVGTLDPLLDDSLFMASRWLAAGSPAELCVYPGGAHAFTSAPTPLAQQARARIADFLRGSVAPQAQ